MAEVSIFAIGALIIAACSTGSAAAPSSTAEAMVPPTYHNAVKAIFDQHCTKCHQSGGVGPFPLTTYDEIRSRSAIVEEEVTTRRMPPWTALDTAECMPPLGWRDDERLDERKIATLRQWMAIGMPEGEEPVAELASVSSAQAGSLGSPTYELAVQTPYLPSKTHDDLRCFVIDVPTALENGGFLSAIDILPSDRRIVHHANIWADVGGIASSRAGADGSFDCFGTMPWQVAADDPRAPQLAWLFSWAPGARPFYLPEKVGLEIPAGSKLVMQVHYSVGPYEIEPESTRVQLVLASERPSYLVTPWPVGNAWNTLPNGDGLMRQPEDGDGAPEFRIPARASDHVEGMLETWPLVDERKIFGVRAHAHLAANDIKVDLLRVNQAFSTVDGRVIGEPPAQCLLQDRWDFHWQRSYVYDAPIESLPTISPGDRLRVRCTYDNTMANARLGLELNLRGLQPSDIRLGEATFDEMCLAEVLYLRPI